MNRVVYIMILTVFFGGSLYAEDRSDCNLTKIQKDSVGAIVTHEPKRSPVGEYITITIKGNGFDFNEALYDVKFCNENDKPIYSEDVEVKELMGTRVVLSVKVPKIENMGVFHLAKEVKVVVVMKDNTTTREVEVHRFKLSSRPLAILFWLFAFIAPWIIASYVKKGFNPICFVSGDNGRASISLTQILIWTMLVFSASFYVFEISGKLLDLTDDVLILLGFTGGVSLISSIVSSGNSKEDDRLSRENNTPRWIDLFQSDQRADLFRVQMALFTVLAVIFVTCQIYAELVFPELPKGLLALIGISNGVYLSSKKTKELKYADKDKNS